MQPYFTRVVLPLSTGYKAPDDWDGCWKIYTICPEADKATNTLNADLKHLEIVDRKSALTTYVSFLNKANTGQNLKDIYNEKQCHEAHSFKINGEAIKIFRIWGGGAIRIYFIYLPNKIICILKTWPKRKDNLSKGEKLQLEELARQVLDCLRMNDFNARVV